MKLHKLLLTLSATSLMLACSGKTDSMDKAADMASDVAKSDAVQDVAKDMLDKAMSKDPASMQSGIDTAGFDTSVRVQDDFYEHVNGTWLKNTEIPADKSNYSLFAKLADEAEVNIRNIIEEVSKKTDAKPGSAAQKVRDYYNTYLSQAESESNRLDFLKSDFEKINAVQSTDDLYRLFGEFSKVNVDNPVGGYIYSDAKDPNTNVVYITQAGLTLPDRDYYLQDKENFAKGRELFKAYVNNIYGLTAWENGAQAAERLLALQTKIAELQWTKEDNRNPVKTYNPMDMAGLAALAPGINWNVLMQASGIPAQDKYIVSQPDFFTGIGELIQDTSLDDWKEYLRFNLVDSYTSGLGKAYTDASFNFYSKGLQGTPEQRPLWKRAVSATQGTLGEVLGQLYVEKHFQPEAKERMVGLVENLKKAYAASIKELDWMSEATKQQALVKLDGFRTKIGYPDKWRDYSKLEVLDGDLMQNIKNARLFGTQQQLDKLGKPVDKEEWFMNPQTVNAYYNPVWNEIVFPAAILQPPFFNLAAEDAVNYGGIGAVIGHEIGHGFDDSGRRYYGDGNLRDWWTAEDAEKFDVRKNKLAAQYDSYVAIDDLHVNGQFTSGENIGDLGGLSIAYKAYKMSLDGKPGPVIDNMSAEQRLFYGWAQVWRRLYRDAELKRRITTDPHSPARFRGNGAVVNIEGFYKAFDVKEGDGMYLPPEERVKIW
ncbi:MAG: peptidase M13 [Gammaproteobacteria bacterium]|nr:peptidase M13 [Gammaproteobacteria bacterium]